tara:strand:- start:9333 stop:10109 length:777 start_codon:yes stop_codon:yes gene_type:complete
MNKPIGIFDSGIGGISILNRLVNLLPLEDFIYLADNKNCPYGNKSKDRIWKLSLKNCEKLIDLNCKLIIVACNTATTNSINKLRSKISIPIIGIEPGLKPAIRYSRTNKIGVLATEKTLKSKLFHETLSKNKIDNLEIYEQIGYDLVQKIENGVTNSFEFTKILRTYLNPMIKNKIDCLILGCTHYHFLTDNIKKIVPKNIKLIDTITPVANNVVNTIKIKKMTNKVIEKGVVNIFYNGNKICTKYLSKKYKLNFLNF